MKVEKEAIKNLFCVTLEDVNGEYLCGTFLKEVDSEWEAGVGKSTIVSATERSTKNLLVKSCVYAVVYYKDTFHTKTKCEK